MRLVHEATGAEAQIGEVLTDFRGYKMRLISIEKPRSPASTGRVYVRELDADHDYTSGYYPSVFDLEWIEREDR